MPDSPQTASFHVDAIAAQRVGLDIRLMVRTSETAPFALLIPKHLAAQVGLAPVAESTRRVPELHLGRPARRLDPLVLAGYEKVAARIKEIGPGANISAICRLQQPPIDLIGFFNWRKKQTYAAGRAAQKSEVCPA